MIEHADHIGRQACRDHSHPVMRISLKEPEDSEGKIFSVLLAQATQNPSAERSLGGSVQAPQLQSGGISAQGFPNTNVPYFSQPHALFARSPGELGPGGLPPPGFLNCTVKTTCRPCTRCVYGQTIFGWIESFCFASTCCDITTVECTGGI